MRYVTVFVNYESTYPVGGELLDKQNCVGVCCPLPRTFTLFMINICDFPYPIYHLTKTLIPVLNVATGTVAINIIYEGLLMIVLSIMIIKFRTRVLTKAIRYL